MKQMNKEQLIRGFLFACTEKTQDECFKRLLFGADKAYAPIVIRVREGDLLFLNNLNTNVIYGVFRAVSNGKLDTQSDAWNGKYPYQVKVELLGEKIALPNSKKILNNFKIKRNTPIFGKKLIDFLNSFVSEPNLLNIRACKLIESVKERNSRKNLTYYFGINEIQTRSLFTVK